MIYRKDTFSSSSRPLWISSVIIHINPSPNKIPMYGGRCVIVLNTGTKSRQPTPTKNKVPFKCILVKVDRFSSCASIRTSVPFIRRLMINTGMIMLTRLGRMVCTMMEPAVICPPIQSMVVVTSPMATRRPCVGGDHHQSRKSNRSSFSAMILRSNETSTMVVVRLSSTAERKKVSVAMIHTSFFLLVVLIRFVIG